MKVILSQMIVEKGDVNEVELNCSNIDELYEKMNSNYPNYVSSLFNEDRSVKNNVILALDGKVIRKKQYAETKFEPNGLLEILLQLAGGWYNNTKTIYYFIPIRNLLY